jgi:hypothetical protein
MITSTFEAAKSLREYVFPSVPGSAKSGAVEPMARGVGSAPKSCRCENHKKHRRKEIFLMIQGFL